VNDGETDGAVPDGKLALGFWGVEPREAEDGTPDINFRVFQPNAPRDQRDLKNEVERALTTVKSLYGKSDEQRKLREALRAFEADIVEREAATIKNQYMRKLGIWSCFFAGVGMIAILLLTIYQDSL
jgi:hypothetical protein